MVSLIDPALRASMLRSGAGQGLMSLGAGLMAHGTGGGPQALQRGIEGIGQAMDPMRIYQAQMIQNQLQEHADKRKRYQNWDETVSMLPQGGILPGDQPMLGGPLVDMPGGGTEPTQTQTAMLPPQGSQGMTLPPGVPPELLRALGPEKGAALLANFYKPTTPKTVSPGGAVVNPLTGEVIYQAPFKPQGAQSDIGQLYADYQAGRISKEALDQGLAIKSKPLLSMPGQESEEAKAVGKYYGEQYTMLQDASTAAQRQISNLNALDTLLEDVYTGSGGAAVLAGKKLARMLGADPEGIGSAEAAVALANEQALQLRNPAGGAGMPGAMSDRDREFLQSMVPGLGTTPEGRKLVIDVRKRMAERDIEVARMARDYRKRNGRLDEGFYDELDAKFRDSNMFADLMGGQQGPSAAPAQVSSQSEYDKLPSGAAYVAPDGKTRIKR